MSIKWHGICIVKYREEMSIKQIVLNCVYGWLGQCLGQGLFPMDGCKRDLKMCKQISVGL